MNSYKLLTILIWPERCIKVVFNYLVHKIKFDKNESNFHAPARLIICNGDKILLFKITASQSDQAEEESQLPCEGDNDRNILGCEGLKLALRDNSEIKVEGETQRVQLKVIKPFSDEELFHSDESEVDGDGVENNDGNSNNNSSESQIEEKSMNLKKKKREKL